MSVDPDDSRLTLTDVARSIARSWRIVTTGGALGLLLGVGAVIALPQTYTATTAVRVDPTGVDPLTVTPSDAVDLPTQEQVVMSRPIAGSLDIDARVLEGSHVLAISCTSRSPQSAARGAERVATAYLDDRRERALTRARGLRAQLQQEIIRHRHEPRAQLAGLQADLIRSRRLRTDGGEVIDPARAPAHGNRPGPGLTLPAGGLLGLIIAMPCAAVPTRPRRSPTRAGIAHAPPRATEVPVCLSRSREDPAS